MPSPKRSQHALARGGVADIQIPLILLVLFGIVTLLLYLILVPEVGDHEAGNLSSEEALRAHIYRDKLHTVEEAVFHKRDQFAKALGSLSKSSGGLGGRLKLLRDRNEIVGENLAEIRTGKETVQEILHAADTNAEMVSDKPPMTMEEIVSFLSSWIHGLHKTLWQVRKGTYPVIWQAFHDYAVKTLYVWDREYLTRMPPRRDDGSIFLSVASYRDENCPNTLQWAYEKAKHPEKLFVGLVQQNCEKDCVSGVMDDGNVVSAPPDVDCYQVFCDGTGKQYCENDQIRVLNVAESESLGPYAARYFASKLWFGEQWYMQIDTHMTFAQDWDATSVEMLQKAPSDKPIISHYPPSHTENLENLAEKPSHRICGPVFATDTIENQVIRLEESGVSFTYICWSVVKDDATSN